jgi:hypothetical protein
MTKGARKLLATVGLGVALVCTCPVVTAAPEQNKAAQNAAFTLFGATQFVQNMLNQCREVDSNNAALHDSVNGFYLMQMIPVLTRGDEILREEGIRSGNGERYFFKMLYPIVQLQTELVKSQRVVDPEGFLARCRASPEPARRQLGDFSPLRKLFPAEMRELDNWR